MSAAVSKLEKVVKKEYAEKVLNDIRKSRDSIGLEGFRLGKSLLEAQDKELYKIEGASSLKEWLLREGLDPSRCSKLMHAWRHAVDKSGAKLDELGGVDPELIYHARKVIGPKNKDKILEDAKNLSKDKFLARHCGKQDAEEDADTERKPTFKEGEASNRDKAEEQADVICAYTNEDIGRFLEILAERLGKGILGVDFVVNIATGFDAEEVVDLVKQLVRLPNVKSAVTVKMLAALSANLNTDGLAALNIEVDRILGAKMKAS